MKIVEKLFEKKSIFDTKNKLNRLGKKVDPKILEVIEQGITIEDLDKINLPIFKYQTQITIHGIFPELENQVLFGYKSIFQNKNKSIGVKWVAIDEAKRKDIANTLKHFGISYRATSTEATFSIYKELTDENVQVIKNLYSGVNTDLFFGQKYLSTGNLFGREYIVLEFYINGIYEKNVQLFLDGLGATKDETAKRVAQKEKETLEREEEYRVKQKVERERRSKILENEVYQLVALENYPKVERSAETGTFISLIFETTGGDLTYKVTYVYLPKNGKKKRSNSKYFSTVLEALAYKPEQDRKDYVYEGRVTGYKIN